MIPILLYLGPNEVPKAISLKLSRDISQIERYYEEIKTRIGHPEPAQVIEPKQRETREHFDKVFAVGDLVDLPKSRRSDVFRDGIPMIAWNPEMDVFCGRSGKVIKVEHGLRAAWLDVDNTNWAWAFEWLEPKEKKG